MSKFGRTIRPHVQAELRVALEAEAQGQSSAAFWSSGAGACSRPSIKRSSTCAFTDVCFSGACANEALASVWGKSFASPGAATKTAIGLVPYGNTGGSNVSPFKRMPVPPELEALIQRARFGHMTPNQPIETDLRKRASPACSAAQRES